MGFLGIIPADKLSAFYDGTKRTLILYAAGEVKGASYGFNFERDASLGGLKFTLQAWTGPLTGKQQKYDFQQSFQMILPSRIFPSGSVTIITARHPEGIEVPIRYAGVINITQGLTIASVNDTKIITKNNDIAEPTPGHTQLNVLFKTKFTIKANAHVPMNGSVTIMYDPNYVQQTASAIQSNDIVWTFLANEMGNTHMTVTTSGGIASYVMVQTYDVRIFVL